MKWSEWKTGDPSRFIVPGAHQYRETDEVECWVWLTFETKPSKCFGKLMQWKTVYGRVEEVNDPYFVPSSDRLGCWDAPPFGFTFQELIGKLIASKKRGIQASHRDNRRLRGQIKALEQMEEPQ